VGRICRKKGFKSGMKERVGDEKLIIISVAVTRDVTPQPHPHYFSRDVTRRHTAFRNVVWCAEV